MFSVVVGLFQGCPLSLILFVIFMARIPRHSEVRRVCSLGTSELGLCLLQMMWFFWLPQTVTFSMHWGFAAECEAPRLRVE